MSTSAKMGRPIGSDSHRTRARLMEATVESVASAGYLGASIRDIADHAGLTSAALYHHFSSKDQLVQAAAERLFDEVSTRLASAASAPGTIPERVAALLEEAYNCVQDVPQLVPFGMALESVATRHPQLAGTVQTLRRSERDIYRALIDEARASGELPADFDSEALEDTLTSLSTGLTMLSLTATPERHLAAIRTSEKLILGDLFRPDSR